MANYFLKVNKDLFNMGLTPVEILLIAQITEFQTNTGDCFISDKTFAESFGVSESTIKREIKRLEELGFVSRDTKNVKGGRERHIRVNLDKIEQYSTKLNLTLDSNNKAQNDTCTRLKMSFDKEQNDTIKDNIKDKGKDNIGVDKTASLRSAVVINSQVAPVPVVDGTITNPKEVTVEWLREQYRSNPEDWISHSACKCVLHKPTGIYYKRIGA